MPQPRCSMAYDKGLAQRVRQALVNQLGIVEKEMFGGIGFLLRGNMCCGVHRDELIVRVGPEEHSAALAKPHARPFDLTGRPMKGWVFVAPTGYESDEALKGWVRQGVQFALSLPPKWK